MSCVCEDVLACVHNSIRVAVGGACLQAAWSHAPTHNPPQSHSQLSLESTAVGGKLNAKKSVNNLRVKLPSGVLNVTLQATVGGVTVSVAVTAFKPSHLNRSQARHPNRDAVPALRSCACTRNAHAVVCRCTHHFFVIKTPQENETFNADIAQELADGGNMPNGAQLTGCKLQLRTATREWYLDCPKAKAKLPEFKIYPKVRRF